jgi:hypothetical protein
MTGWSRREKSEFKNFMNACYGNTAFGVLSPGIQKYIERFFPKNQHT